MHRLMFANLENKREKNATRVVQNVSFSETMTPHPRYKLYIALKIRTIFKLTIENIRRKEEEKETWIMVGGGLRHLRRDAN